MGRDGADFVKKYKRFHPAAGTTVHSVALMSRILGTHLGSGFRLGSTAWQAEAIASADATGTGCPKPLLADRFHGTG